MFVAKTTFNANALPALQKQLAGNLLRAAITFQTEHKRRLNIANPPPYLDSSVPGEYPRARTGFGRDGTIVQPTDLAQIARTMRVKCGYIQNAWYMGYLEVYLRRKGLNQTLQDMRSQIRDIIAGKRS